MTTIAWDGTTLAADQCSWSGGVRRKVRKVFKLERAVGFEGEVLVAFAGTASYCLQVLAWMKGQGERPTPERHFKPDEMDRQCAVLIDYGRRVWACSNDLNWQQHDESMFANGAGQEFAWGALEAGATAQRAVEIAIKRSDYAGFGVDTVTFGCDVCRGLGYINVADPQACPKCDFWKKRISEVLK